MIVNNVNPNKLYEELVNAGIEVLMLENNRHEGELIAENTWITFAEGVDINKVNEVIDAHDPAPLPQPKTETEILKEQLEATEMALIELMKEE